MKIEDLDRAKDLAQKIGACKFWSNAITSKDTFSDAVQAGICRGIHLSATTTKSCRAIIAADLEEQKRAFEAELEKI